MSVDKLEWGHTTGLELKIPSAFSGGYNHSSEFTSPLTRQEKLALISSILSGVGSKAHFDEETIKSRIEQCLSLAETVL